MTEQKLNKIEESLNFYKPKTSYNRSGLSGHGLYIVVNNYHNEAKEIHKKSINIGVRFSADVIEKMTTVYKTCTFSKTSEKGKSMGLHPVAFSLGTGDEKYIILNPAPNVPHFQARIYGSKGKSAEFSNRNFVNDIYQAFHIDASKTFTITLKLTYFAQIQGMDLYKLSLEQKTPTIIE